jgi:transcription elongation factor GreA
MMTPLKKIPFTKTAYEQMQRDVLQLKDEIEEVIVRLTTAREMGDLSENGAYRYAKIELGDRRRQLSRLRYLLLHGEIVEPTKGHGTIGFGSTIQLHYQNKDMTYILVNQYESDPSKGKVSQESPLGKALLGKKAGDHIKVSTPSGEVLYFISSVS